MGYMIIQHNKKWNKAVGYRSDEKEAKDLAQRTANRYNKKVSIIRTAGILPEKYSPEKKK